MSGAEEEWVKAAMTDDTVVVELLLRLHGAAPPPLKRRTLPLEWSVRQRRSKPVFANTNPTKQVQSQRASPTTPLSWSGATSLSGGSSGAGGGSEESSLPPIQKLTRSKVHDNVKPASKRSRKKKTLAELKEEEKSLLKERRELQREIAAMRINLERERAKKGNLKRMKIELQPHPVREITSLTKEPVSDTNLQSSSSKGLSKPNAGAASDPTFALPDLNIPFEDEPYPDPICGVS